MKHYEGRWLIAVSGGPDSMALLSMCLEEGIDCAAAHVNYHHRPEADSEEQYVRSFCAGHGITVHVLNDPFTYTGNFEAAARTWRYDFFVRTVREYGYRGVMIAHQEDDLIETFLMQEEKGITPSYYGLKEEMMYQGVQVVRPLLSCTRKELEEYCSAHQIRYCVDRTNLSDEYTRNRIRHELVEPMSAMERKMVLQEIRRKNAVMQERNCRIAAYIREEEGDLSLYRKLPAEERETMVRMILKKNVSGAFVREIDGILLSKDDFVIDAGEKQLVQKEGKFFLASKGQPYADVYETEEELVDVCRTYYRTEPGTPGVNAVTLCDADFPVTVRSFREGDRIRMRFGTKPVHRFFIDRHIPLYQRPVWPVVENAAGEIILVPGLGCDISHFSINPDFNVLQYSLSE